MSGIEEALRADARTALAVLDRVLEAPPDKLTSVLPEAIRALVQLRDRLTGLLEAAEDAQPLRETLDRTNAALSVVTAGAYPMVGISRERAQEAREALARLADDL